MNELANDYSKEGTAKYDKAKEDSDEMFEKALPYFQKSEKINGKDMNTLIALKEIFARKNQFDKAEEYKAKIEALNAEQ
jgi:tetratricopeptide (TPR) repeat protein